LKKKEKGESAPAFKIRLCLKKGREEKEEEKWVRTYKGYPSHIVRRVPEMRPFPL